MRYELSCRHNSSFESALGCHGNHAFSHSPKRLILEVGLVLHLRGPNKHCGTHEKLSCGGAR